MNLTPPQLALLRRVADSPGGGMSAIAWQCERRRDRQIIRARKLVEWRFNARTGEIWYAITEAGREAMVVHAGG